VAPSGTWAIDGDVVDIRGVHTPAGPRNFWFVVDTSTHAAFGRDNRTAAIRAQRSDPA
jgi:hypothetical protein